MKNKKNAKKYIALIAGLTVLCTAGFFVASVTNVFGQFVPKAPYVTDADAPSGNTQSLVSVTNEGGNQKGSQGSGVPTMPGVPTAEGVKGSETNPFVILEIVPEHAQQQLIYLNTDNEDYPIEKLRKENVIQLGIDESKKQNINLRQKGKDLIYYGGLTELGDWIVSSKSEGYDVFTIGGKGEKRENVGILEARKLFSKEITNEDIEKAGYTISNFETAYNYGYESMQNLINKFHNLFDGVVDVSDEKLKNNIIADDFNWEKTKESAYIIEVHASDIAEEDQDLSVAELAEKYPELFKEDKYGKKVSPEILQEADKWEKTTREEPVYHETDKISDLDLPEPIKDSDTVAELAEKYPKYFKDIPTRVLNDQDNWTCNSEEKTTDVKYVSKTLTDKDLTTPLDENATVEELSKKYPDLFEGIPSSVLKDQDNWKIEKGKSGDNDRCYGYLINVGAGNGLFAMDSNSGVNWGSSWADFSFHDENPLENQWIYSDTLPSGSEYFSLHEKCSDLDDRINRQDFSDDELVGGYLDDAKITYGCALKSYNTYTFSYKKTLTYYERKYTYEKKELYNVYKFSDEVYRFTYWGLETTDVLKRSLFVFDTQEECDNFHMQVIAMTPAEINKAVQGDTDGTLDIIERADMFYIGEYDGSTNAIGKVYELYYKYIEKKDGYVFSADNMKSFAENDLEWASCYKIMNRLCNNPNLPLMLTQGLGVRINTGVDGTKNTHMYVTDDSTANHIDFPGTLNNLSKLYLLTVQFDMLARKSDASTHYERTFYEDILPNLQTVAINPDSMADADEGTATTTGYYERQLVEGNYCTEKGVELSDEEKKTCYYLWNTWTFYPSKILLSSRKQQTASKDKYIEYGYLDTFFDSQSGDVFLGGVVEKHSGSDGDDGKNVGIVHLPANADVNFSTMLGNGASESHGVTNEALNTAYKIMNKQSETLDPLKVKVEKQKRYYQKISDDLVMIDYSRDIKYKDDKTLYVKLTISNSNNDSGILKSISLVKNEDADDGKTLEPKESADESVKAIPIETVKDINDEYGVKGYKVPPMGELTIFVPYKLSDWQSGKHMIKLVTQSRKYKTKDGKNTSQLGAETEHYVDIAERQLFALR